MEAAKNKKYMSDIHLEDYTEQYEIKHATADTMVFDGGRRTESVIGVDYKRLEPCQCNCLVRGK